MLQIIDPSKNLQKIFMYDKEKCGNAVPTLTSYVRAICIFLTFILSNPFSEEVRIRGYHEA